MRTPVTTDAATPSRHDQLLATVRRWVVAISLLLVPGLTQPFVDSPRLAFLFVVEFLLLMMLPLSLRELPTILRSDRRLPVLTAMTLSVAMVVAVVFHPSPAGFTMTLFAAMGVGLTTAIATMDRSEVGSFVAVPLLVAASFEAGVMAVQWLTGRPFVLDWVFPGAEIPPIDGFPRPPGTLMHVYQAAILGLVALAAVFAARGRGPSRLWLVGIAGASAAVGLTNSRSGLLAIVAIVATLAFGFLRRRSPTFRNVAAAVVVGFLVSVLVAGSGWLARLEDSTTTDLDELSLGRVTLVEQSLRTIRTSPWVGVGPGRYVDVGKQRGDIDERRALPVHDLGLMIAAELGIPAALAVVGLLAAVGVAAWRRGPWAFAAFVAVLPFLVLDVNLYDRPFGLVLFAAWLGSLSVAISTSPPSR